MYHNCINIIVLFAKLHRLCEGSLRVAKVSQAAIAALNKRKLWILYTILAFRCTKSKACTAQQ